MLCTTRPVVNPPNIVDVRSKSKNKTSDNSDM